MALDKDEVARLSWILQSADDQVDLTDWERNFIDDLTERFEDQGKFMTVSDKMWEVLERIHKKAPG